MNRADCELHVVFAMTVPHVGFSQTDLVSKPAKLLQCLLFGHDNLMILASRIQSFLAQLSSSIQQDLRKDNVHLIPILQRIVGPSV